MLKYLFMIGIAAALSACDTQVKDFVDVQPGNNEPPPAEVNANAEIKVSPGNITATTATHRIEATITPTSQKMTSPSLGLNVGIQKVSRQ